MKKMHYGPPADDKTACGRDMYHAPRGIDDLPLVAADLSEVTCLACKKRMPS